MPRKPPFNPLRPTIRLHGEVNDDMVNCFWEQLQNALDDDDTNTPFMMCLTTLGGDADCGRRIADDMRLYQQQTKRDVYFLGKSAVMSAGVTIMSAFPTTQRYLTRDCALLIHERKLKKEIKFDDSMACALIKAQNIVAECENAITLERQGFADLAEGSKMTKEDVIKRVKTDWYILADEAIKLGLIQGTV